MPGSLDAMRHAHAAGVTVPSSAFATLLQLAAAQPPPPLPSPTKSSKVVSKPSRAPRRADTFARVLTALMGRGMPPLWLDLPSYASLLQRLVANSVLYRRARGRYMRPLHEAVTGVREAVTFHITRVVISRESYHRERLPFMPHHISNRTRDLPRRIRS